MQLGIIYSREPRVDTDFLEKIKNKSGRGRCRRFAVNGPSIRDSGSLSLGSAGMTINTSGSFTLAGKRLFTTVNGLSINSSAHYTIAYETADVLLTVVRGPVPAGTLNLHARTGRATVASEQAPG